MTAGVLLLVSALTAQQPPPESISSTVPLRGRVVDGSNGAALPRARVVVRATAGESGPVFADDRGGFEVAVPEREAFVLQISKPGYAVSRVASSTIAVERDLQVNMARGAPSPDA